MPHLIINEIETTQNDSPLTQELIMKRLILTTFALLLSLNVIAAPLPAEQLSRINNFIAASLGDLDGQLSVNVTEAQLAEDDAQLEGAKVEADFLGLIQAALGLKLQAQSIGLSGGLAANITEFEIGTDDIAAIIGEVKAFADAINAQGDYSATIIENELADQTQVIALIAPNTDDGSLSIKSFQLKVEIPKDLTSGSIKASFDGAFNAIAATVQTAKVALSNIVNALINEQAPAEEDITSLLEIIASILENTEF